MYMRGILFCCTNYTINADETWDIWKKKRILNLYTWSYMSFTAMFNDNYCFFFPLIFSEVCEMMFCF